MMRDYKRLLTSLIQTVVLLLSAFGGFLKKIAPPEQTGAPYAVGIISFLVLIALLIVSALATSATGEKFRRAWLVAGVAGFILALPPSLIYHQSLETYTWSYPPESPVFRIRGLDTDFTREVKDFLHNHPEVKSPESLARNFDLEAIWTPESLQHASMRLLLLYTWLVLALSTTIFCLLEAIARPASSTPGKPASEPSDTGELPEGRQRA